QEAKAGETWAKRGGARGAYISGWNSMGRPAVGFKYGHWFRQRLGKRVCFADVSSSSTSYHRNGIFWERKK
ncbi:unnamed protein product, partial [Musa acuminata var. zebrina]